jgi:hypothetical protein
LREGRYTRGRKNRAGRSPNDRTEMSHRCTRQVGQQRVQGWIVRASGSDSSISRFIRTQLSFAISLRRVRTRYQRLVISARNATSARVLFGTAW